MNIIPLDGKPLYLKIPTVNFPWPMIGERFGLLDCFEFFPGTERLNFLVGIFSSALGVQR
jgi:hypothetical protein